MRNAEHVDVHPHEISIVIPVYRGEHTLPAILAELALLTEGATTPQGVAYRIVDVIPVWDHGPDQSAEVITDLAEKYSWLHPVWLSRNFGQHPATLAGIAKSFGDWVVTLDEDGQHDPQFIGRLLDKAIEVGADLVYAEPTNNAPHSRIRNTASRATKGPVLRVLLGGRPVPFHSFRLIRGELARSLSAYCGPGVYLDIALGWIVSDIATCPVPMRLEGRQAQSYSARRLLSHFWRLVLSSGNRPLRIVSSAGALCSLLGIIYSLVLIAQRLAGSSEPDGWTSTIVAILVVGGLILISLGIIAEYVGLAAAMSMGKPLYVATGNPVTRGRTNYRSREK